MTGLAGIGSHAAAAVSTVVIPRSSTNGELYGCTNIWMIVMVTSDISLPYYYLCEKRANSTNLLNYV